LEPYAPTSTKADPVSIRRIRMTSTGDFLVLKVAYISGKILTKIRSVVFT